MPQDLTLDDTIEVLNRRTGSVTKEEVSLSDLRNVLASTSEINYKVNARNDFLGVAGATLPPPYVIQDTSSAGTPVLDYVSNALNGEFKILHDNQSEAQLIGLNFGDSLLIDVTKNPVVEMRVKINFAGAAFTADQRAVFGLASARNATLDSVAVHAWFRVEGANLSLFWETDDGTTDNNDQDTGVDLVDNTYVTLKIDLTDLAAVKFYIGGTLVGTGNMSAATGGLQVFIEMQRDAGAETEEIRIDYIDPVWDRS